MKPFAEQGNFTQIHNSIIDNLMQSLSGSEFMVLMAILRKTIGWQKDSDKISIGQLQKTTGLTRKTIIKASVALADMGIVTRTSGDYAKSTTYKINRKFEIQGKNTPGGSGKNTPGGSGKNTPTKETSSKEKKKGTNPPPTSKPPIPLAIKAYQHVAHLYPDKALWTDLDDTIGDKPESLKRWQSVVKAYIGCGWNKRNINAMLDFYRRGEIPGTRGSNDNKPTTVPPKDYGQFADKAELLAAVEAAKERERQEYEKLQKRT